MSRLMHMRQRIKAVQTIKKITHAMRLISMSSHSRMKHQEEPTKRYQQKIHGLFSLAKTIDPDYHNRILMPERPESEKPLVILVGSQKGLCGAFNSTLFQLFNINMKEMATKPSIITVGKRASQYLENKDFGTTIATFDTFGLHNLLTVTQSLLKEIIEAHPHYSCVTVYSNTAPTFFMQKPQARKVIPATLPTETKAQPDYIIEQPTDQVLGYLAEQYLFSHLQQTLFQSLLAEHSARFVSMDSSTRNAETMLEQLQIDYNKLRQAKITRELTELSAFFLE